MSRADQPAHVCPTLPLRLSLSCLLLAAANAVLADTAPFAMTGSWRLRHESLTNSFRAGNSGGDQALASRLLLSAKGSHGNWRGEVELQDARLWLDDTSSPLGTDDVNALEPLQAWIGQTRAEDDTSFSWKAGRFTMDLGHRRLVARNRFRNTANHFAGIQSEWLGTQHALTLFHTWPLLRQPDTRAELDANRRALDQRHPQTRFSGGHLTLQAADSARRSEWLLFHLDESDSSNIATANRQLLTAGIRSVLPANSGDWDHDVELALQWGNSHPSPAPTDTSRLEHRAWFLHLELGYTGTGPWSSRQVLQLDVATGDKEPGDHRNQRFDTLFGARRYEYGPSGINGLIVRSNLLTPGFRWEIAPRPLHTAVLGYRTVWLHSAKDQLAGAGLRDPDGTSGRFVGQQWEATWNFRFAGHYEAELGTALLVKGSYFSNAPDSPSTLDTLYWHGSLTYTF